MDADSRHTMLGRTEFWVVVTVIVMFMGCVAVVNAVLEIEAMIEAITQLETMIEMLDRVPFEAPHLVLPMPTP